MLRVVFILIFLLPFLLFSQKGDNETRLFYANKYRYQGEDAKAISMLNEILKADSTHRYAYHMLAEIYNEQKKDSELSALYARASGIIGEDFPEFTLLYGNTLYAAGQMQEAGKEYEKALKNNKLADNHTRLAQKMLEKCRVSEDFKKRPVPFSPVNMGSAVNSGYEEYLPSFSIDRSVMFITRKLPAGIDPVTSKERTNEDFFSCEKQPDGSWSAARPVTSLNTSDNEGAHCLSADGNTLVFTACNRYDSYGTCDLYLSSKNGNYWTTAQNMGPLVNSTFWDSQPSLSSDGKTVYYASKRKGGKGGTDIWYSKLNAAGRWMEPVNLGDTINTPENEISPFLHPDGVTLYFASKGHPGVGNYDIFMSRMVNGKWTVPVNLGYPINTEQDEMSLIVDATGKTAYYASVREGGYGGQDIYSFELYPEVRAGVVTWIKGHVCDSLTKKNLKGTAELYHIQSGTLVYSGNASEAGNFLACFHQNGDFAVNVTHPGYMIYSDHFTVQGDYGKTPFVKEILMKPVVKGASMNLRNIYFDTDLYQLKPESGFELNKLYAFLKTNQTVYVNIIGHTDNQGGDAHNLTLSKNRADVVMKYLSTKGIAVSRMTCEGMGATRPIADNSTEEGRAMNRRTEIIITAVR
jgi:flagellar motor protein MotB